MSHRFHHEQTLLPQRDQRGLAREEGQAIYAEKGSVAAQSVNT